MHKPMYELIFSIQKLCKVDYVSAYNITHL